MIGQTHPARDDTQIWHNGLSIIETTIWMKVKDTSNNSITWKYV